MPSHSDRPRLLDLFCGAGGAAMGYHRAGFEVVGVDLVAQPHYPFEFHQADAMTYPLDGFDAIHASPHCQGYSRMRHLPWLRDRIYPLLIDPMRERLNGSGALWVMENVEDAPLPGITLCGVNFGLKVYRHRRFASNWFLPGLPHAPHPVVLGRGRSLNDRRDVHADGWMSSAAHGKGYRQHMGAAMGIDWMTREELSQAIPPAYTEFLGRQLLAMLSRMA